jgi:Do/DeqQ family serine protease
MKTKKILSVFGIALLSAFVAVFAYSRWFSPQAGMVEADLTMSPPTTYVSLPSSPQIGVPDLTQAAEKSVHAVVHVKTQMSAKGNPYEGNPLYEFFFNPRGEQMPQQQPVLGSGSGVIITKDGYIITNNHVIEDASEIEVTLNDNRTLKAILVGTDPTTDIALLKIDASDLTFLSYGNSDALKIGEWVLAVGNPFNLTSTVTAGIVSAKSRSINILNGGGRLGIESFIQTDAAVNPGNSGGALVNTNGELVGINSAIASRTGSYSGYSFAVPVSIAQKVVADLMEFGEVQRGLLGISIQDVTSDLAKDLSLDKVKGVHVAAVQDGSGAKEAGIEKGDVIISVNNEAVNKTSELQEKVSRHRPGDKVNITLIRDGKTKQFSVTLQNIYGSTDVVKSGVALEVLGATFDEVPQQLKEKLNIRNGLQIKRLSEGKLLESGIKEGYIISKANRVPINNVDDLRKVVDIAQEGLFLTGIYPNGQVAYYAINLQQ